MQPRYHSQIKREREEREAQENLGKVTLGVGFAFLVLLASAIYVWIKTGN